MSSHFVLFSSVEKLFADLFKKLKLSLPEMRNGNVKISNSFCEIELNNVDNRYVGFIFRSKQQPELGDFLLTGYLDTLDDGLAARFLPPQDNNLNEEFLLDYYLGKYEEVFLQFFDKPLKGDFSWVDEYKRLQAEWTELSNIIFFEIRKKNPDAIKVYKLMELGELGWKAAARKLIEK